MRWSCCLAACFLVFAVGSAPADAPGHEAEARGAADPAPADELAARIEPRPQYVSIHGPDVQLTSDWRLVLAEDLPQYHVVSEWFNDHISPTLRLPLVSPHGQAVWPRIVVGDPATNVALAHALDQRQLVLPEELSEEGYLLAVYGPPQAEILIAAHGAAGAFYGVVTLLQLVDPEGKVPGVLIVDFPDHDIRGSYEPDSAAFEFRDGVYHFSDRQRSFIDWLAAHKMNVLFLVENGVFFKDEKVWLPAHIELFEYARTRFVEPVPRLCSISTISPFPFELYEGWFVEDERFTFNEDGLAVPQLPPLERVTNGGFELDEDGDGVPEGWQVTNVPGAEWQLDDATKFAGRHAMRLSLSEPVADSHRAVLSTTVKGIEPNSHYCVWSKARAERIESVRPQLTVYVKDTMGNVSLVQSDVTWSTAGWIDFGVCLRTPSNPQSITIYARQQYPGSGTFWLDEVKMRRMDGSLVNVIRGEGTDIRVTDLTGLRRYELGIDYQVIDGQRQKLVQPTLTPFVIRRLPQGAIAPGETVLVSYDAYYNYNLSRYWSSAPCLACERLYTDFLEPAIDRLTRNFKLKLLNIDADEIRGFYRDSRLRARFGSNAEAIAYWANRIERYVANRDPGCRLWLWADMVSPYHNGGVADYQVAYGGQPGRMAEAVENDLLPRSLVMDVWWYGDNWLSQMWHSVRYFGKKGYNVLGSPWQSAENIISWSEILLEQPHVLGGVETNWGTPFEPSHRVFADHFWNTRERLLFFDSFEDDTDGDGLPDGWLVRGPVAYSTDGTNCHGTRYAGFPNAALGVIEGTQEVRSPLVKVQPNVKGRLSVYARRLQDGPPPRLAVAWWDGNHKLLGESAARLEGVDSQWARFDMPFTAPPEARWAAVRLDPGVAGIWYDVLRLTQETHYVAIISPKELPPATTGAPYEARFRAIGGLGRYAWSLEWADASAGLTIDAGGTLTGVPQRPGRYRVTVVATDVSGLEARRDYALLVRDWQPWFRTYVPFVSRPLDASAACSYGDG